MAPLRYAAKFDPFLSLDCAHTPSTLAKSKERKGSNFAIWQPCHQTGKAFHRESEPGPDGRRRGEYGYIDPLGVRRVVTYDTGPGDGELERGKENDFVGDNTYFESV